MAICKKCGAQIDDQAAFCPVCGAPQDVVKSQPQQQDPFRAEPRQAQGNPFEGEEAPRPQQVQYVDSQYQNQNGNPYQNQYQNQYQQNVVDNGGFGWALLGFCIPLVGLILFLVWKDTKPRTAKSAGKGALVSVIVSAVIYIITIVIGVGAGIAQM